MSENGRWNSDPATLVCTCEHPQHTIDTARPEPAIVDWYSHCGVNEVGGSGGMLPQENFLS